MPAIAENHSFAELFQRVSAGDQHAAEELFHGYESQIRRVVRVRLTDPGMRRQFDSVDICQSVMADFFVRASLGQYELQSSGELVGLLATMARNRLINHVHHHRAQKRDVRRDVTANLDQLPVTSRQESPSRIVADRDLLAHVRAKLTAEERHLADRRSQGSTWQELAIELGASPDALRVRLARALDRVTQGLGLMELQD